MKELKSNESYDFFTTASCITYCDILYNELHDMKVKVGDDIKITYSDGRIDRILIKDIEYLDGTIWVEIIE
jgi:hypothetical protein